MIVCFDIGGTTMKGGYARAADDIEVGSCGSPRSEDCCTVPE